MLLQKLSYTSWIVGMLLSLSITPVLSAPFVLTPEEQQWLDTHREITIYSGTDVPPLMFQVTEGRQAKGIAIDYVNLSFSKLGISPRFSEITSLAEARKSMENQQGIDLIPLAAITPENSKRWALTKPFYSTPLIVFSRKDEDVLTSIEQFEGRRIAYFKSAKFVDNLKRDYAAVQWIPYDDIRSAFDAVAAGKADGVIAALTIGAYIINQNGLNNLKVATTAPLPKLEFSFALHKDNHILAGLLSKAIDSLSPAERNTINKKWLAVRFEHGLSFQDVAIWVAVVAFILSAVIVINIIANRRLRREIVIRKQTESELLHAKELADSANRAKSAFLSIMSHELRTPLTAINGAVTLANSGILGELNDKGKELFQAATRNCGRLQRMINDVLDMEKITSGRMHLDVEKHGLAEIIDEAIDLNQSYAANYGMNIINHNSLESVLIPVDRFRFIQVLTNLLSNACKYSAKGGDVTVSAALSDSKVRISVHNQGPAIKDEFRPHIFDKFTQADLSDTRSHSGSGLGLTISKELMQYMHGEIGFESDQEHGTTFYVELPIDS